jgi:hypothetical protein
MSGTDELKNMLLTFRVSELQMLLGYAGQNKTGRKTELQARAIELLKNKSIPHLAQIHAKIRELYKTIQQGGSAVVQQQQQQQQMVSQSQQQVEMMSSSLIQAQQQQQRSMIQPSLTPAPYLCPRPPIYPNLYGYTPKGSVPSPAPAYPIQPDVRFKRLPFYDILGELLKPSSLVPNPGQRNQEANFMFCLTPQQASDVALNRDVGPGTKNEYLIQVNIL